MWPHAWPAWYCVAAYGSPLGILEPHIKPTLMLIHVCETGSNSWSGLMWVFSETDIGIRNVDYDYVILLLLGSRYLIIITDC